MKLTKLSLAMASVLAAGFNADAFALDLYVDTKTQQIFAEPGKGRVLLGEFQKVGEAAAAKPAESADLKAEIAQIKQDLALKNNEIKALDEHVNDQSHGVLHMDEKGVRFESKDGNFDMAINGRLQVDSQMNVDQAGVKNATGANTTNQLADGTSIRRARLGVEGSYYKDFGYKFEYDFTRGNGFNAGGITDAYVNWKGYDPLNVTIGQFKEPFSLEEATSNRYTTFIERNMAVNAFSDNNNAYKMGLGLAYSQPRWTAQAAIQTESVGNGSPTNDSTSTNSNSNANRNNGSGDTGWGLTGRLTGLPWAADKTHFAHVGVSGSERYLNVNRNANGTLANQSVIGSPAGILSYGSALDTNVDRTLLLNTGALSNTTRTADTITRFGGESAVVYGPFSAQAEYIQTDISGKGYTGHENLNGYYGYASYFLTGESRTYKAKTGAWDRIKPHQNFSTRGGWGAWEIAAGYDHLDLNSGVIQGGRASTGKVGLNWYPNSRVRLMANYIHVLDINTANAASVAVPPAANTRSRAFDGTNPDIFEIRGQLDF
ncbi:MAG: OprO/OprP family phosphate-selective porin [Methylomonas sp.]